jgi:sec-independent protein translocase protein TatA
MLILLLVLLLFGAKKLPDTARGLGRSLRIFKAETKGLRDDDDEPVPPSADDPVRRPAPREVTGRVVEDQARVERPIDHPAAEVRTDPYGSSLASSGLGSRVDDPDPSAAETDRQARGPAGTAER